MADQNMRILIVDDMPAMRNILKNLLNQIDFKNLHEADDGTTALVKLKNEKFDFVLADWNMPKMNGLELLKKAKANEELKDIPFLMVTAEALKDNIIAAMQA